MRSGTLRVEEAEDGRSAWEDWRAAVIWGPHALLRRPDRDAAWGGAPLVWSSCSKQWAALSDSRAAVEHGWGARKKIWL